MSDTPLHGIAVYNPDLWSKEELKRYFIARKDILDRILRDLHREKAGTSPQHRLILGHRGMGKTTLLRRIGYAVEDDEKLGPQWLPLTFPEEQYNIAHPADMWLNCLDALSDHMEQIGNVSEADAIDEAVEGIARTDTKQAQALLLQTAKHLNKRLILLIDNIDLVLDRLKKYQWELREVLQSEPSLMIIGASSRAVEASYKYDAAFYDFFRVDELKGLTEEEMRATLLHMAEINRAEHVTRLINEEPARIRTLHTLTGGNPRTAVMLYSVLAQGFDGDVRSDLEGLLDKVTPLYKARFEELPAQAQQVVDALAIHWDPATARTLAEKLAWDVNTVSAQLNRLVSLAVVEKVKVYGGKRAAFQISERFFNIWYLMRASRRLRRKLMWLVQFLKMFFNAKELQEKAKTLLEKENKNLRVAEDALAYAQCIDEPGLRGALEHHALHGIYRDPAMRREASGMFDFKGEDAELLPRAERIEKLAQARERIHKALAGVDMDVDYVSTTLLGDTNISLERKLKIVDLMESSEEDEWQKFYAPLANRRRRQAKLGGKTVTIFIEAVSEGEIAFAHDIQGAVSAAERHNAPGLIAFAWIFYLFTKPLSEKEADTAKEIFISSEFSISRCFSLMSQGMLNGVLNQLDGAEKYLRLAIKNNVEYVWAWAGLGCFLSESKGKFDEAERAYHKAIECDPTYSEAVASLGWSLMNHTDRYKDAEGYMLKAIELDPNDGNNINNLGCLYLDHLANKVKAEQTFHQSIDVEPAPVYPYRNLARLLGEDNFFSEEAIEFANRAIKLAPEVPWDKYVLLQLVSKYYSWSAVQSNMPILLDIEKHEDGDWYIEELIRFIALIFQKGDGAEALKIIDSSNTLQQLRPLREALAAAVEGTAEYLNNVAPEIHQPALEIFHKIAPDIDQ